MRPRIAREAACLDRGDRAAGDALGAPDAPGAVVAIGTAFAPGAGTVSILTIILVIVLVGVLLWALNTFVPMVRRLADAGR